MFRNPNLRTYERKRPGIHSTSSAGNTMIREDVPPDKNIQSKELSNPKDGDDTMLDDPFDTTFDRLLKTAKMPPKPPSDNADSSYAGSSSDEERAKDDSLIPLPPMFDEPAVKKRRFFKREKADKKVLAVMTGVLKRVPNRPGRPAKFRNVSDENTEPNIERSPVTAENNSGKNIASGSREESAKRQRDAKKRTPIASYRGRKRTIPDDNTRLARCSVNLTTLDLLHASAATKALPTDPSGSGKTEESESAATPGPSEMPEKDEDRFTTAEATSVEEFVEKPATSVDATPTPEVPKSSGLLKNPTVCLIRLSVPQRFSVANKSWINSTPIDRRTIMKKTRLRLSPIDANGSTRMRVRHGDENSGRASLPAKSPVPEPAVVESTVPRNSQPSSEIDVDQRSEKRRAFVLSESPAPEPSCLLFDDSEAPDERSSADEEQSEDRRPIVLSESPAPEPSCLLFDDTETADETSQIEEKLQEVTEASTTTPFKGFSGESSDPESLQLRYEASNRTASSEDIAPSAPAEFSLVGEETHDGLTKDSSDGESLNFTLNDDDDEDEDEDEQSSKDLRIADENSHSVSHPAAPSDKTADIADASTNEQLGGFPESSKNSTVESATDNTEKFDSDDDWTTVTGSSYAEADVSGDRNMLVKGRESIEQLSSDDDDSLSDDISELVNAHDALSSHMEEAMESSVGPNLEDGRSAMFEDINGNESKVQEPSVVEEAREKETRQDIRLYLRQPVVLLERLVLPVGKLTSMGSAKDTELLNPSELIESSQNSTLSSADGSDSDIETPIPAKKSKRPSKVEKTIARRFSDNMELSQNSTLSSADGSVSNIETPIPAKKSKRPSKVEKTIATRFSDNMESSQNTTLSSADGSVSDIETPIPAKKSKRPSKVEKTIATRFSDNMESSQNTTLSSADGSVSDIETPIAAKKSKRPSKIEKPTATRFSDTIKSGRNSTLSSADGSVSDIETPIPAKKSKRPSKIEKPTATRFSDTIKSGRNSTLSSADGSVSDIETPIPAKKSKRPSKIEKPTATRFSDTIKSGRNSTLSSADGSVSDIETPIPAKKSKRPSKVEKPTATRFSDTIKSGRNSTLSSADGSVSDIEEPLPPRKSRGLTNTKKGASKDPSDSIESSQNLTLDSVDGSVSDIETPIPAKISKRPSKIEKPTATRFSDTIKSGRNSTLSSADGSVSDIEEPLPPRKSRGLTNPKKAASKDPSESIEASQNSTLDSADGTVSDIEEPLPPRMSRGRTITKKAASKNPSDSIESSHNSTLDSADGTFSDIEEPLPPRKSRGLTNTKKAASKDASASIEASQNSTLDSADGSVSDIEEPLPPRKSRGLTITKKAASKDPSESIESDQNSTLDSADGTVSDIEEQLPTKKSRRLSKVEKTIATSFSDAMQSGRNSTLSSANDGVSFTEPPVPARESKRLSKVETDIEDPLPTRKSRRLTIIKKSRSKYPSDSLELPGTPTSSANSRNKISLEGDKEPEVDKKESKSSSRSITVPRKSDAYEDTRLGSVKPVVLLTRLNDPVRVSLRRRQKYSNMNLQLSAIAENTGTRAAPTIEEAHEENKISESYRSTRSIRPPSVKLSGEEMNSQQTTASVDSSFSLNTMNESRFDDRKDRRLFLKPGKFWARSLSILSNVHSQEDLESLAVGKGKKWRESAANILQMQQQGLLQSCVKKNEDDKESRSFYGVRNSTAAWGAESSQSNASRVFGPATPERFVRRVSIRVVPDGKSLDRIEDSPFLEAYGITSSRNRQTISKRSTSIGPRKTLVYNVQDVRYDNVSRGINSTTSRDVVLKQCGQETSLPFDECYPLSYLKHCRKIGEGVYGEVFLYEKGAEKNVIKIIPIEGEMNVNNERQKKFDEILSEIVIAKELHNLRFADSSSTSSFVEVKNIRCVAGKYPRKLIDLWKTYDDEKNSENDCPVMFDKNQLYIVLELGHGGQDLEAFVFQNASESHALFMQAAVALAVAEEKLDFEHRDLHWGNILISRTEESHVEYKLRDKAIRLASKGVKVSVIDFTLSRMSYQGCSIYNDLSMDEDLFSAQGEYQFEIYRLMRKKVENDWQRFEPFTNVLWLHYTLEKMITAARYRRKNSKIHNTSIEKLRELKDTILNYKSAFDFVTNCDKATRLQGSRTSVTTVG